MTAIQIPELVRIKPGALNKLGTYCNRREFNRVVVVASSDMPSGVKQAARDALAAFGIHVQQWISCTTASFEQAQAIFISLPGDFSAILGLGGGKALDVAKYVAYLAQRPMIAVPTSLSNDGFCSPTASLTVRGLKRSLPASLPFGVIIDTAVCLAAPEVLWHAGIGDLVAKFTAVQDWKLAFHAVKEPFNDFAALLSDATVYQFLARPAHDLEGVRLLGTSLMLNGVAMEVCHSSRPASGSEHLLSHALDRLSARPRLHGLQVGVATYLVSKLQGGLQTERIYALLEKSGFWQTVHQDPFSRVEWLEAAKLAPTLKNNYYTVFSARDCVDEIRLILQEDTALAGCFMD